MMAIDGNRKPSHQLKLDFDPFDPDEPTSHFFPGGNRQNLLDQLIESCSYSSDVAVVTGPLGSGKSTTAQWLAHSLEDDFVAVLVRATLFMSAAQLLEAICEELSLEVTEGASTDELVEQLDVYAESLRSRSRTLQLLVDDAHELGEEALQVMLDLLARQADSSHLGDDGVKVILFGESMLLNSVQQLVPSTHSTFELEPLDADEIIDYVAFKLAGAGYHGKFPLDIDAMTVIDARSQGVPGAISSMVKDELVGAISQRSTTPDLSFVERHLVAASVLFGALLLALFFTLGGDDNSLDGDVMVASGDAGALDVRGSPQRVQVPLEISSAATRQSASDDGSIEAKETGAGDSVGDSSAGAIAGDDAGESAGRPVAQQAELRQTIGSRAEQPGQQEPASAPLAEVEGAVDSSAQSTADDSEPKQHEPPLADQHLRDTKRVLLARSPESYTLQLLGSHSEANVKNFIASNSASTELTYFESRFQDRPWFVVVHGSYANRNAAADAIDALPPSLRELKPFARNLSDIQADIRKYQ